MKSIWLIFIAVALICRACNEADEPEQKEQHDHQLKEQPVSFALDTATSQSLMVWDEQKEGKRPVVLVIHEWWGLNDYPKMRARQLAEMGYLALAVDLYGNGKQASTPEEAQEASAPFYQDPQMALNRLNAALAQAKSHPLADTGNVAAIGYCFGGGVLLNSARLGLDLDGVVSFHGSLTGTPARKDLLQARILVCHGGADSFVPEQEVQRFQKTMDSINADYTFKVYPGATHAFTNPNATEAGKKFNIPIAYNPAADSASWNDMKEFFGKVID